MLRTVAHTALTAGATRVPGRCPEPRAGLPRPRRLAAVCAAALTAATLGRGAEMAPQVELSAPALDWGKCGHRQELTKTVVIKNAGGGQLKIEQLKSSCGCTALKIDKQTLGPNESAELSVVLSTGTLMGYLQKYLEFHTNDPRRPVVRIPVLARVHDDVKAEPWVLPQFTAVAEGPPVTQEFTLAWRAKAARSLVLENLRCTDKAMRATAAPITSGGITVGYKLAVTVTPPAAEGLFNGNILADLNGLPWEFRVYGQVFVGIIVEPTYFQFGRIDDPENAQSSIDLKSADGTPFRLLDVACTPASLLAFTVRSNDARTAHTITAKIARPDRANRFFGKVRIRTDHPKKALIEATCLGFWPAEAKKT
ncbi:MAG TPA: DUF1573 domain-containing protein [Planctomycetota bacterium]|nr:MAG: hypothetical protein BWX69_02346 [Planctomycetes bacterium ADurb.Bin069]HNU26340.1 DUF1573 domain-containing protein [Planctomycetota bacterium]HPY70659.1 DUF1573 domain-containing protein [Planctomycetota bacterium]